MTYNLFLNRDYLTFSSAHFVIGENFYEPLHGHNYKILINVYGTQGKDNMVIDFHDIKKILKPFVDSLDHYVLVPSKNKFLEITEKDGQVIIKIPHLDKEYELPKSDVVLLPIENTTVEEMSHYFVQLLAQSDE
ncbi:MAG: 6-carboxytetrahydropterin synthase, partial [Candidatus Heimdallarchaeota archaeon]|nr:6-carboxytetrahydropterin synthase [Candidatus Heimdallarchaeota archaeon]MCK4610847.1 6-carboxytetrahydropterin synthase [Candidatus Heimdallarchaeota archaeon]